MASRTPPKQLRKEILEVFKRQPNKPLNHKQVASTLGVLNHDMRRKISVMLEEMGRDGRLESIGRGKFVLAEMQQEEQVIGTIQVTRHGRGFVMMPDGNEISIPKGYTGTAFWGDTVEVDWLRRGRKHTPRVARIVERQRKQYVVVLEKVRDYAFGYPSDQRLHTNFFIGAQHLKGAENGQKVIIEMVSWDDPSDAPSGRVVEILGKPGDHEVEMHAILAEYGLPYEFPDHVLAAADAIPHAVPAEELKRRRDFRDVTTLTIDPVDAKDFDDALSLKRLKNGHWEVGVHIADVAHYLKPGTVLDEEARQRATSVYLVDRTIPMLPEVLSNNLCSLRPNEDRLAFSAVFEMNEKAEIKGEWFGRSVIHSDQRFAYHEAQERIETGKGTYADEVNTLQRLAVQLRANRFKAGGIDFNTEEVKFELDEAGKPLRVVIKRMLDANRLIEDFMLLANVRVSRYPRQAPNHRRQKGRGDAHGGLSHPRQARSRETSAAAQIRCQVWFGDAQNQPCERRVCVAAIAPSGWRQHRRKRGKNHGDSFHGQGGIQHQQHRPLWPRFPVLHPLHESHPPVPPMCWCTGCSKDTSTAENRLRPIR